MVKEAINIGTIHRLKNVQEGPQSIIDVSNEHIRAVLGNNEPVIKMASLDQPSKQYPQNLWFTTEPQARQQTRSHAAIGLYFNKDGLVERIIFKRAKRISSNMATVNRVSGETIIDINPRLGLLSGTSQLAEWVIEIRNASLNTFKGRTRLKKDAPFTNLELLNEATPKQKKALRRAGLHPKLFFAAQELLNQQVTFDKNDILKIIFYGGASLASILAANLIISIPLKPEADLPALLISFGMVALSALFINQAVITNGKLENSLRLELETAKALKDNVLYAQALIHHVTAGWESFYFEIKKRSEINSARSKKKY